MTISRRSFLLIAGFAVLVGIIVALWWLTRPPKTDRQQIVNLLAHTEQAIEQRDLGGLMQAVSEDYDDGTYSKRELRRAALAGFREVRAIRITPAIRRPAPSLMWTCGLTATSPTPPYTRPCGSN